MTRGPVVTIDGPAGAGKTTVGRELAYRLGLPLLDTGLFYRALTVAVGRAGVGVGDRVGAEALARSVRIAVATDPDPSPRGPLATVDGEDVTAELFDPGRAELLAWLAQLRGVRRALLPPQQRLARRGAVVLGRDAGSVVVPAALCKLYLDASPAVREARRAAELRGRGRAAGAETLRREVTERDRLDRSRREAPLRVPRDATMIVTDRMSVAEVVDAALEACRRAGLAIRSHARPGAEPGALPPGGYA